MLGVERFPDHVLALALPHIRKQEIEEPVICLKRHDADRPRRTSKMVRAG
jgi:hypothetical protein